MQQGICASSVPQRLVALQADGGGPVKTRKPLRGVSAEPTFCPTPEDPSLHTERDLRLLLDLRLLDADGRVLARLALPNEDVEPPLSRRGAAGGDSEGAGHAKSSYHGAGEARSESSLLPAACHERSAAAAASGPCPFSAETSTDCGRRSTFTGNMHTFSRGGGRWVVPRAGRAKGYHQGLRENSGVGCPAGNIVYT
eukprot:gene17123-biopygen13203